MRERNKAVAGAAGIVLGLMVLFTGTVLDRNTGLESVSLMVLLLAVAGAVQVIVRLRSDLLLGAAMSLSLFLPYVNVSGLEIRASTLIPTFLLVCGLLVTARTHGLHTAVFRDATVRWMVAYVGVVIVSTVVNLGRLGPDSLPFLALWLVSHVFFLFYVLYRPRLTMERQLQVAEQMLNVLVLAASIALTLGVIEYFRPDAVEDFFAPARRVGLWGARGALAGWLIPLRRTGSIIGSPNAFGALLAVGALVALGRHRDRTLADWVVGLTLAVGVVLLSTSRGATMGFLAGVSTYVLTSRHRWWAVPLLAAAVGIGALMPATVEFIGSGYVSDEAVVGRSLPAAAERFLVWSHSLQGGLSPLSWIVGGGPVNTVFVVRTGLRGGHNLLVTNLAFFGLLGVTCVLALCREVVRATYQLRADSRTRVLARVTLAVFVALFAHSMVDDMLFHNTSIMLVLFPLLAMVVRARQLLEREAEGHLAERVDHHHAGSVLS